MANQYLNTQKTYFYNLDGIRSLACIGVFICHFYDYMDDIYIINNPIEKWIREYLFIDLGPIGVNLFFVLSGFLITYFLLLEKKKSNFINLKRFYFNRLLRIWPVFYFVVILLFIFIPILIGNFNLNLFEQHFPLYLFFTNNFDRIYTQFTGFNSDSLGVLWSIAVEEQFYLVWPIIIMIFKPTKLPFAFLTIIFMSLVFRWLNINDKDILSYHTLSLAGDLVIGSCVAYLSIYSESFISLQKKMPRLVIWAVYIITISLIIEERQIFANPFLRIFERLIFSSCFAFIIAEQNFSQQSIFKFEQNKILSRFSFITYGFYCYHMLFITIIQKTNLSFKINRLNTVTFYSEIILTFLLCYGFSLISYYFFERKFLMFKK